MKRYVTARNLILFGAMIMILAGSLAGCGRNRDAGTAGDQSQRESRRRIALITKAMDSEFWTEMRAGAEDAAKELGIDLSVLAPDMETNVERQFKIIEDAIAAKYDAIIVAPCDSQGVIPVLEDALKAKIVVFGVDTNFELEGKHGFVGTDNIQIGKTVAKHMEEILKDQPGAKVAIITGVPGVQTMRDRNDGFKKNLSPALKLVGEQPADSDSGKAMSVMENMLTTHPDLAGVYILNTTMATGALQAVSNYKSKVKIISVDTSIDHINFTKEGLIEGFVSQDSYGMGYNSVVNAVKALNDVEYTKTLYVEAQMITRDNVEDFEETRNMRNSLKR